MAHTNLGDIIQYTNKLLLNEIELRSLNLTYKLHAL